MDDRHVFGRTIATKGLCLADLIDNIHTFHHFPKDRVLAIKEVVVDKVDEELGSSGVRPGICHRDSTPVVLVVLAELVLDRITGPAHAVAIRAATL